jgi:uracil-DNA glycosylase
VRACRLCNAHLPLGARPVLQISPTARVLVASQAPGTKVHASGIPFDDDSGARLREWMSISRDEFYDAALVAIVPMGLCYPGRLNKGGDAPPRPECAPLWRTRLLGHLQDVRLTLLVGTYAQAAALGPGLMTERVRNFRDCAPGIFPLPHPSWRSRIWAERNPWFAAEALPALRRQVREALA